MVLGSNAVRRKQVNNLVRREASVTHASQNGVRGVGWLRDEQVGRRLRNVRTTSKELETRATSTVGDTDSASELDAIRQDVIKLERW